MNPALHAELTAKSVPSIKDENDLPENNEEMDALYEDESNVPVHVLITNMAAAAESNENYTFNEAGAICSATSELEVEAEKKSNGKKLEGNKKRKQDEEDPLLIVQGKRKRRSTSKWAASVDDIEYWASD
ncbi:hypothetical protein M422DRAFT_43692 [Sphaerobolus stellatus SS14]|nr:hypothetical protein M422DRAFT_43692 [Sphaerobolus stellatus SS14]